MQKGLFRFFIKDDIDLSPVTQKKIRYLVIVNLILVVFFTFMVVNRLIITFQLRTGLGPAFFDAVILLSLAFIRFRKYNPAVLLTLTSLMLCSNAVVYTAPAAHYLDIYKQGFFRMTSAHYGPCQGIAQRPEWFSCMPMLKFILLPSKPEGIFYI